MDTVQFHGYTVPAKDAKEWEKRIRKGQMKMEDLHEIMEKRKTYPYFNKIFIRAEPNPEGGF